MHTIIYIIVFAEYNNKPHLREIDQRNSYVH